MKSGHFIPKWYDSMWNLEASDEYQRKHKWFEKKRPRELRAVLDNLDTYLKALCAGAKPAQIKFGFIHIEPNGILAIDQKGGGPNLAQTRLYVFPDTERRILHLFTLGGKATQAVDIQTCRGFVKELRERDEPEHEEKQELQ